MKQIEAARSPSSDDTMARCIDVDSHRPKLLVSVRSADEAMIAAKGGADVLDVKEPMLGSLGMASCETINEISQLPMVRSLSLSVALGEVMDWTETEMIPRLPTEVRFTKLGLAGCQRELDWSGRWKRIRAEFESRTKSRLNWVAVAYADFRAANSPSIQDIIQAAITSDCAGLLIDTWSKDAKTLLDHMSVSELKAVANTCRNAGLFLALAGKLTLESVPCLATVNVDLLAIRSAACQEGNRTMPLQAARIQLFLRQMEQCFIRATS